MQKKKRDFLFDTHNSNHGFCFGGVVVVIVVVNKPLTFL